MGTSDRPNLTLDAAKLEELTNNLKQPAAQLKELHRQGFVKACRPRMGRVVLYRAHYEAVLAGREPAAGAVQNAPTGPNVVGLQQWTSKRKHGTQTQRR